MALNAQADAGTPAPAERRDPRRALLWFSSLLGVALASGSVAALWIAARGTIHLPFGVGAALVAALGLSLMARGLTGVANIDRRSFAMRLDWLSQENADLAQKTRELQAAKQQLEEESSELQEATREGDMILRAAQTHLMLIDPSHLISGRYALELEELFGQPDLAGKDFLGVLRPLLSERTFKAAGDYLALLFDPSRKERTVAKVNPLDEVEIGAPAADGGIRPRFLTFRFRRIVAGGVVVRVLVSVEDVTERTIRERRLRKSEQQRVKQFELLLGILDVEPATLDGFMHTAKEELAAINQAVRASDFTASNASQTELLRRRLDVVLARAHAIKGNASLLHLNYFEGKAQEFEEKIVDLKHRASLGGDDFLMLVGALAEFQGDLDDLDVLRAKLAGIKRNADIRREVGDDLIPSIGALANRLGRKLGKHVVLEAADFDSRRLPPEQRLAIKDVLIQLVRNSLVHGIETGAEREAAGKARIATIGIATVPATEPGGFAFTYRDDGRGLDAAKIRARALDLGLLEPADAAADDSEVASLIFEAGFTTVDGAGVDAGRGMGMNVVKRRIVDDCEGEIAVHSEPGRFCEFTFELPAPAGPDGERFGDAVDPPPRLVQA